MLQCAQMQGDWIVGLISRMKETGERKVLVEKKHEEEWLETILKVASMTLVPGTKSVCLLPPSLQHRRTEGSYLRSPFSGTWEIIFPVRNESR